MTPQERAEQLISKFRTVYHTERIKESSGEQTVVPIQIINSVIHAKIYALIAVDEIINANPTGKYGDPFIGNHTYDNKDYWIAVKQEIEKI